MTEKIDDDLKIKAQEMFDKLPSSELNEEEIVQFTAKAIQGERNRLNKELFKVIRGLAAEHGEDVRNMTAQEIMEFDPYQGIRDERALSDRLAEAFKALIEYYDADYLSAKAVRIVATEALEDLRKARQKTSPTPAKGQG